jgi:hypothetical protein
MWLCDLEKAVEAMRKYCPTYLFEKVAPAPYGIVFFTTHFSRVFWSKDGKLIERYEDGTTLIHN